MSVLNRYLKTIQEHEDMRLLVRACVACFLARVHQYQLPHTPTTLIEPYYSLSTA